MAASPTPAAGASAAPASAPRVQRTVEGVGRRPRAVAVAGGAVWVLSAHEKRIARLDADTGHRLRVQPFVGLGAAAIARDAHTVWVAKRATSGVLGFDPRTGVLRKRIPTPLPPARLAAGPSGLWVVARAKASEPAVLLHYDRAGALPPQQTPVAEGISAIAEGGGTAWVALATEPRIMRVKRDGGLAVAAWLSDAATWLSYGGGRLWASLDDGGSVARIHPGRPDDSPTTDVGPHPAGLAMAGGRLFVASHTRHRVLVLDPAHLRKRPLRRLRVPLNPYAMAAGHGHVWVTGMGRGTVTRIDP